tara:strand:- start:1507 stop:2340 length:834 start_codon:yes stop_codon:yes gene_type:complete
MFSLNKHVSLDSLQEFMLFSVNNINYDDIINISDNKKIKNLKPKISKNLLYPNYNKAESKYNEKHINKRKSLDNLFWLFYKIVKNLQESDLYYLNTFVVFNEFKNEMIDKIRNNKNILKKYKLKINFLEDDILNNKTISLYTLRSLCILYDKHLLLMKDNNTYSFFSREDVSYENLKELNDENNLIIVKLLYSSNSSNSNSFTIEDEIKLLNSEIEDILNKYYYIDNLEKPLKGLSSYKSDELYEIANKLNIQLYCSISAKKKIKKVIYDEIMKKLI